MERDGAARITANMKYAKNLIWVMYSEDVCVCMACAFTILARRSHNPTVRTYIQRYLQFGAVAVVCCAVTLCEIPFELCTLAYSSATAY